jgi:Right handed beta helix region
MRVIRAAEIAVCLSLALASCAQAITLVVRQDGTGDVATITEGLQKLAAQTSFPPPDDTLWVEPGNYDETVVLPGELSHNMHATVYCPGGPDATQLRGLRTPDSFHASHHVCRFEGLRILNHVQLDYSWAFDWFQCRFDDGFVGGGSCFEPNFVECEFRGPVVLSGYNTVGTDQAFDRCHFLHAPLLLRNDQCGDLLVRDCTFEGADTLVRAVPWDSHDAIGFYHCVFKRGRVGLVLDDSRSGSWGVGDSRFEDLDGPAILRLPLGATPSCEEFSRAQLLSVSKSRFDRCGSALSSHSSESAGLSFYEDTLSSISGSGIDASNLEVVGIGSTVMQDIGGVGIVLKGNVDCTRPVTLYVSDSDLQRCAEGGLVIDGVAGRTSAIHNRIHDTGGDALTVIGNSIDVENNLVYRNRGAGIIAKFVRADLETSTVAGNTSALNDGAGLIVQRLPSDEPSKDGALVVTNNLVANNQGDGLTLKAGVVAEARHNDSWINGGQAYVGSVPPDQNLTLNPLFCDLSADDFQLQPSSPCASSGPFGQIGALGVGCEDGPSFTPVRPHATNLPGGKLFIRVATPSVDGAIAIETPTSDEAELSIYDLAGRRVGSSRVSPGSSVSSSLQLPSRLPNGVYLVRVTQGSSSATHRLVLLR